MSRLLPVASALALALLAACSGEQSPAIDAGGADPSATAAETAPASAAPASPASDRDALKQAMGGFLEAESYRATMIDPDTGNVITRMEYVAPDRFRIAMPNGATQVMIGRTAYMTLNGQTSRTDLPEDAPSPRQGSEQALALLDQANVVRDGRETVNGEEADVFVATTTEPPGETRTWISRDNGLPLKSESSTTAMGKQVRMRIEYADFNDASISIEAPAQ